MRLFIITSEEEVKVVDMCWEREGRVERSCNWNWRKELFHSENEFIVSCQRVIKDGFKGARCDKWSWNDVGGGV